MNERHAAPASGASDLPYPLQGGDEDLIEGQRLSLGGDLSAYYVRPRVEGPFPGVIVFMEAFGLNDFVQAVCKRLAAAGYAALAPDFYHGATFSYDEMDAALAHLRRLSDAQVVDESRWALDFLAERPELRRDAVGVLGFCMGGRLAFLASAQFPERVRAAVCFYGAGIAPEQDPWGRPALLDRVPDIRAPLMLHYGAQDGSIKPDEQTRIAAALSAANKRFTLSVFKNAGHGFFSDRRKSYVESAATEAWAMSLRFFERHLKAQ